MPDPVQAFFTQWEIYRLCLEHNTLHHREVGKILQRELQSKTAPFTFLDLACGDAELTSTVLLETSLSAYTGVDFCAPALALAKTNLAKLPTPITLQEADFTTFLAKQRQVYDIAYLGLSLHHLDLESKRISVQNIRRCISPDGIFYLYEPFLHSGENREQYVDRWIAAMDGPYDAFPSDARASLQEHVSQSEQPESLEDYLKIAKEAGFTGSEILFRDAQNFYALLRFTA